MVQVRFERTGLHADGCQQAVFVSPGEPQVSVGRGTMQGEERVFTLDNVYEEGGRDGETPMERALFEECVRPLIRGLLAGQNATVSDCNGQERAEIAWVDPQHGSGFFVPEFEQQKN